MVRSATAYDGAYEDISVTGQRRLRPFAHLLCGRVYAPALADELLNWLEVMAPWHLHEGSFYEQHECDLLKASLPDSCVPLVDQGALARLRAGMEAVFKTKLTDRVEVVAHKLTPGQGIGLHNDDPHGEVETETHRLIVQLNHGWQDQNGGHLLLFNSRSPSDIYRVVKPVHNTGIGIAFSQKSYHAVSDIREGERYTVIYSFWQAVSACGTQLGNRSANPEDAEDVNLLQLDLSEEKAIAEWVNFLRTAGADSVRHSKQDLLSHLVNTYKILQRWNCSQHVCLAGLFHNIYGNESFYHAVVPLHERKRIQDLIGIDAEELVYTYCVTSHEELTGNLDRAEPYVVRNRFDGTNIFIDRSRLADLITLILANSLEELPRIGCGPRSTEAERAIVEKAADLLPSDAAVEMRWVYGRRNSIESTLATLDPEARARIEMVFEEALAKEISNTDEGTKRELSD